MSQFAYSRFLANNMLTREEMANKDEIVRLTEEVLDARGIECDAKQLKEILEEVRRRYKKNKKVMVKKSSSSDTEVVEEEIQYIR
jgi:transposase